MPAGEWVPYHLRDMYESEYGVIGYRGFEPDGKKWYNHMPARQIKKLVGSQIWDQYFKFCVIRNPWDKIISMFEAFGREHRLPVGRPGVAYYLKHPFHNSKQLRFLHWLETEGVPVDRPAYVIDGNICVDDVIRFESLEHDINKICKKLGLAWEPSLLPTYKMGVRRKESTISRLYRQPARRLVAKAYAFEISQFGYEFPG